MSTLIAIYKAFVKPHLEYGDQTFNSSFNEKLESNRYNACLALTGAIRGSLTEKIYQELGFESIRVRRCYRNLCFFDKALNNKHAQFLFNLISARLKLYSMQNVLKIPLFNTNHNFFKNLFFPSSIIGWNK